MRCLRSWSRWRMQTSASSIKRHHCCKPLQPISTPPNTSQSPESSKRSKNIARRIDYRRRLDLIKQNNDRRRFKDLLTPCGNYVALSSNVEIPPQKRRNVDSYPGLADFCPIGFLSLRSCGTATLILVVTRRGSRILFELRLVHPRMQPHAMRSRSSIDSDMTSRSSSFSIPSEYARHTANHGVVCEWRLNSSREMPLWKR